MCSVEILRDNIISRVYFPKLPEYGYLNDEMKDKFNNKVDRTS